MNEGSGMSVADVAAISNGGLGGCNGLEGLIYLAVIMGIFNGGFGNGFSGNGNSNAIQNDINRGFDNQNLQAQTRDILAAVTNGTAQSVAASNQVFHDISVGIFQNNVPVPGGTSTVTAGAVGDKVTIPVQTTIKQGCDCEGASNITLRLLDNDADIINVSLEVDKK